MLDFVKVPWPDIGGLRLMGSAALGLTYVACGRLDAYIHPYLYPWDVAAAISLVEESGGKITDWQGQPATIESRVIVAANEALHSEFLKLIQGQLELPLKGA
jgi:myo-inositol-1(or 4)-monophosphatase